MVIAHGVVSTQDSANRARIMALAPELYWERWSTRQGRRWGAHAKLIAFARGAMYIYVSNNSAIGIGMYIYIVILINLHRNGFTVAEYHMEWCGVECQDQKSAFLAAHEISCESE